MKKAGNRIAIPCLRVICTGVAVLATGEFLAHGVELVLAELRDFVDGNAVLFHGVAMAHGDAAVVFAFGIDGDAQRRTDFVLTAIEFADGSGVVVARGKALAQVVGEFFCFFNEFGAIAQEWEYGRLDGGQVGMEAQDFAFALFEFFVLVGVAEECQRGAGGAGGGFDDVGDDLFVVFLIVVLEFFARGLGVLFEVVVGAVGDAFEF